MNDYKTVLMTDDKGRITIPVKVRELMNVKGKPVFSFDYNYEMNEIVLKPIGDSTTK